MAKTKWSQTKYPGIYKYELKSGTRYGIRVRYQDDNLIWKEKSVSGFITISAARKKKTELETTINKDMASNFDGEKMTFKNWYERWFELSAPSWKGDTVKNIHSAYKNYLSEFDNYQLSKITLIVYQNFINQQLKNGAALNSIKARHRCMMSIMNSAVKHELIPRNKLKDVNIKSVAPSVTKDKIINSNELEYLDKTAIEKLDDIRYGMYILMRIGWRTSEILGLPRGCVNILSEDSVEVTVKITKTAFDDKNTPKTKFSYRTNSLKGNYAKAIIRSVKTAEMIHERLSIPFEPDSKIFIHSNGKSFTKSILKGLINRIKKDDHIHPHMFRHTFASEAIANGMSVIEVAKWLGHSKVDMTLNVYSHSVNEARDELIDFINPTN